MIQVLAALARLSPVSPEPSGELEQALSFLGRPADPTVVVEAGYGVAMLGTGVIASLVLLFPESIGLPVVLGLLAVVLLAVHAIHTLPGLVARARETRALGDAPDLVSRAVLSMRLSPSVERAAEFAADSDGGPLARSLGKHVSRAELTGGDPLVEFGAEWDDRFPALGRALTLVSTAGSLPSPDRERTLDRALSAVLEGTRAEMESFAGRVRRPVTGLYAFGVLLPTALVALLPAASAAGVGLSTASVVVVYDLLLPLGLATAGLWLVARRPVAFPPPSVDRTHPDVPKRRHLAPVAGISGGVAAFVLTAQSLPSWGPPFVAGSVGIAIALWLYYRPVVAVYERVRAVESGLTDALSLVGRHVANGDAVEAAVERTARELDGEIAAVFDRAASQQRQLRAGVEASFLGEHGALADVPSPRARGTVGILSLAATEGQPVGDALLRLADHVDDLQRVEAQARRDLDDLCGTLETTGSVFGPMVAGSTVALADGIAVSGSALGDVGGSLSGLGLAIGGYVFASAIVLTALAVSLTRGFDRALVGVRVARAVGLAGVIYPVAYLLVGQLV